MKKTIVYTVIIICALFISAVNAQEKKIKVLRYQNGNTFDVYVKNLSKVTYKVSLRLETTGFKKHPKEITKSISPKDSLLYVTLLPSGGKMQMQSRYSYTPNPTQKEKESKEKALQKFRYKKGTDINSGIVVFDKSNCPRCDRTTSYLLDNNIDFTRIQIPTNTQQKNNDAPEELKANMLLLSKKMRENGIVGSFTTPVILVDGKLTHSHQDLNKFLSGLQKKTD